ncbi:MAG: LCP family protein [Anaerolineales bacterium]
MGWKKYLFVFVLVGLLVTDCNFPATMTQAQGFLTVTPTAFSPYSSSNSSPQPILFTPGPTSISRNWPPPIFGTPGPTQVTPLPSPATAINPPGSINVLLAASDRATPSFRTDTLILVSFQPEYDQVTLLSIPRDLYVYIPGWQMQRINAAYYRGQTTAYPGGGPGLLKDTILYNLGIEVDRVALVDFDGFVNIIDSLGGLDVPVSCKYTDWKIINPRRDPEDEDNWRLFTLDPGVVHMDGDLAFWYARSRKRSSDFDRGRRQQEVLRALYSQSLRLNTLRNAPEIFRELHDSLTTDVDLAFILEMLPFATRIRSAQVRSFYINRDVLISWRTPQGAAVLLPDESKLPEFLSKVFAPSREIVTTNPLVEIRKGTDNEDWPELAEARLNYAGFEVFISNTESQPVSQTKVIGLSQKTDQAEIDTLMASLGLSATRFEHAPQPGASAEYRLILGEDYNPCFDPSKLEG